MTTTIDRLLVLLACAGIGVVEASAGTAAKVAVGTSHTCALTTGGGVKCWGSNTYGQLGDGTTTNRLTPTPVSGLASGVAAIAAGGDYTCALTTGGAVKCWGLNAYGQLGDGTTTDRSTPTAVSGLGSGVAAVVPGYGHTCALTTGGGLKCWGDNYSGQIGDYSLTQRLTPTAVSGLGSGVTTIALGPSHTCALTTGGGVLCWGNNGQSQLGIGASGSSRAWPTAVSGLGSGVQGITAGVYHTCALTVAGGVLCWGWNEAGQLGNDYQYDFFAEPTPLIGLQSGVAEVVAGAFHTCALTTSGGVLCWGFNDKGQLGSPSQGFYLFAPTPVSGMGSGVAAVAAGAYHTCALTTGGGVMCWGSNQSGQLGDGTTTSRSGPAPVSGMDGTAVPFDFTGDQKSDILWRHSTLGDVWLWPMGGATRMSESYLRTVADTNWEIRGLGDQDGDGIADILWRNKLSGQVYLWRMSGSTPQGEIYVATVDPAYDIVGTGDFNGDGKSDIVWRHTTSGDTWIWLMNWGTPLSKAYIDRVDPGYVVKDVSDMDGNGKADIVWQGASGDVWVWPMSGTTRLDQVWVGTVPDTTYQIQQVADFDGNGKADILWWNTERGEVWIWPMNGATRLAESYVGTVSDTNYRIRAAGDYNGDGMADILWRNVANGEVWVWLMDGTTRQSENYIGAVPDTGYQIVKVK